MDAKRFRRSPIGQVVPIKGHHRGKEFSHFAFVPDPLPADIPIPTSSWTLLSEAAHAIGRLDGAGRRLPSPRLLARPAIRQEAVSTSALEGTYTTLPQVLQSELLEEEERPTRDVNEVLGYVRAAEMAFEMVQERSITLGMIKEIHSVLMRDDPECPEEEKGAFRERQNFIGPRDAGIEDSHFVPPPPDHRLRDGLEEWIEWIHREEIPLLVRVATGHYQFETLHPFIDGNGRLGRLIAVLMLLEAGQLTVPLLNISPYLEQRRDEYQEKLREVSEAGDFVPWIEFFVGGLAHQATAAMDKADRLVALRESMVADLRAQKVRGIAIQIAEDLIGEPIVAASRLAKKYGVTYQAVVYAIDRLVGVQVLSPMEIRGGRKIYVAHRVLEELQ
jgi:Fic family protein